MTGSIKQDYVDYRIQSAKETLKAAKLLADNSHWNSAINRLYYTCFYAISALLYKYDINANSHAGLKHQFTLISSKLKLLIKNSEEYLYSSSIGDKKAIMEIFMTLTKIRHYPYSAPLNLFLIKLSL
jgi:uncharacterized protein (UPF0332 family)